jgi:hypothetical protein
VCERWFTHTGWTAPQLSPGGTAAIGPGDAAFIAPEVLIIAPALEDGSALLEL